THGRSRACVKRSRASRGTSCPGAPRDRRHDQDSEKITRSTVARESVPAGRTAQASSSWRYRWYAHVLSSRRWTSAFVAIQSRTRLSSTGAASALSGPVVAVVKYNHFVKNAGPRYATRPGG